MINCRKPSGVQQLDVCRYPAQFVKARMLAWLPYCHDHNQALLKRVVPQKSDTANYRRDFHAKAPRVPIPATPAAQKNSQNRDTNGGAWVSPIRLLGLLTSPRPHQCYCSTKETWGGGGAHTHTLCTSMRLSVCERQAENRSKST